MVETVAKMRPKMTVTTIETKKASTMKDNFLGGDGAEDFYLNAPIL